MTPPPLPWAPRPLRGESLSGWVARVAARYDLTARSLCSYLLDGKGCGVGTIDQLDHRTDLELLGLIAAAARVAPARLRAMRVAAGDGTASGWFRMDDAWCPECVRGDLARGPETHERAAWQLGCFVVCPMHHVLLRNTCEGCWKRAPCFFRAAGGWLGLACSHCVGSPCPPDVPASGLPFDDTAAFEVQLTPGLAALVAALQRDLQAALLGRALRRPWGSVRSGAGLLQVVADLSFCIVLAAGVRFEQRADFVRDKAAVPSVQVFYQPVTPAVLTPYAALGALAIVAAMLDGLGREQEGRHTWKQDGVAPVITAGSFAAWLNDGARRWLRTASMHWEPGLSAAFWAATIQASSVAPAT